MAEKLPQGVETAPDPDEDDLDDLDDVLDAFDSKPTPPAEPKPSASGPGRPSTLPEDAISDETLPPAGEEDLAAQLQAGMGSLISELGDNPEMQQQFEAMMQELIAAGNAPTGTQAAEHVKRASESMPKDPDEDKSRAAGGGGGGGGNFQDTIRKTMERMQQSSETATAASSKPSQNKSEEEMLMEMLAGLSAGSGAEGEGGEEDFNKMLLGMMTQLVHKDILYEPMKELDGKFPGWMAANKDKVKKEDLVRYREQERLVREIVERFERRGYSDEDEGDKGFIVERMQKMQEAGSPPPDLVGDMSAAQEALGELDQGCPTQ